MSQPDDVRKLLGGYATGSLTEAERKLLFDAAMEDQDLFDQIAGEHDLKEILDQPGARQRLLAALEPKAKTAWWPWAAGAAALLSAVAIIVLSNRTVTPRPLPQEVAQVLKSEQPSPVPEAVAPRADAPVRRKPATPLPAQAPQAVMDKVSEPRLSEPSAVGFARGGRQADALRSAAAQNVEIGPPQAFSFRYSFDANGVLEIIPAAPGFLSVSSDGAAIFPSRAVATGMSVRIPIPAAATNLIVRFSAAEGITRSPVRHDGTSGTVIDQDPPNQQISIRLSPIPATR